MFRAPPGVPKVFVSVQYLRGFGALAVIFWHAISQLQTMQPGLVTPEWGAVAVDMFFVISGFVMWHMTAGENTSLPEYFRRRFARIVPFYWAVTTFVLAVLLVAPSLLSSSRFEHGHVLASYLFVPWLHPVLTGQIAPLIVPAWALNYEFLFCMLLGACLVVPLRWRAVAVIAMLVAPVLLPLVFHPASPILFFYTQPFLLDFALGVGLGWLVWNGYRLPGWWGMAALLLGFAIVPFLTPPPYAIPQLGTEHQMVVRVLQYGGPAFLVVAGAASFEMARGVPKWRLPRLVGDASYSLYIGHPLVLPVVTRLWRALGLSAHSAFNPFYLLTALMAALGAGLICHVLVEKPLVEFFARRRKKAPLPRLSVAT